MLSLQQHPHSIQTEQIASLERSRAVRHFIDRHSAGVGGPDQRAYARAVAALVVLFVQEYIAVQIKIFAVRPGVGYTSYYLRVSIDFVKDESNSIKFTASVRVYFSPCFSVDLVVWSGFETDASIAR